jgi:hypothetical protein
MMQPFPIDGHYRTHVISGVGYPRSDSVVQLVLSTVQCAMAGHWHYTAGPLRQRYPIEKG